MYPQQPQYPQQYPPAQPQYPAAPPMSQYPSAQYGAGIYPPAAPAYAPPAAPATPLPAGTLDEFWDQPSNANKSWVFNGKPIGTSYIGVVTRAVTNADIRAVTDDDGRVQTFKDGRTKFVMIVPMLVAPSPEFPDGQSSWWCKGQARDELTRAMAEAGAPQGAPEPGATIRVTLVNHRPIPGKHPAFVYRVEYWRPQDGGQAAPVQLTGGPVEQYNNLSAPMQEHNFVQQAQAPVQQPVMAQQPPAWAPSQVAPALYPPQAAAVAPMGAGPAVAQAPAQVAPVQPAPPVQGPGALSQEQQALLAKLTGQTPQG